MFTINMIILKVIIFYKVRKKKYNEHKHQLLQEIIALQSAQGGP